MKQFIVIASLAILLCMGGCELLTGIGIGVGGSETLNIYEENLEAKKAELDRLYDEELERMRNTTDPNELSFSAEKVQQIQIARAANLGMLTAVQEFKGKPTVEKQEGYLNLLHGLIPIALGYAGIEIRKRVASERKRQAEKQGRELALREIAAMQENEITAPVVKEIMYRDIGNALKG